MFSTGFFLYGSSFLYGYFGSLDCLEISFFLMDDFYNLKDIHFSNTIIITISFFLVLISLIFKLGLAPLHY